MGEITDLNEFLAEIEKWDENAAVPENAGDPPWFKGRAGLWFRGQANAEWDLQPQVLRDGFRQRAKELNPNAPDPEFSFEASLFNRLRRLGAFLFEDSDSPVAMYFLAQHHGLPTRLLDWTENPLAALFFAVEEELERDAAVFCLPSRVELRGEEERDIVHQDHEDIVKFVTPLAERSLEPPNLRGSPLRVMPDLKLGRMLQQAARFTLHHPGCTDLANLTEKTVVQAKHKHRIRDQLRLCGIHRGTLFPDLSNLVSEIRYQARAT